MLSHPKAFTADSTDRSFCFARIVRFTRAFFFLLTFRREKIIEPRGYGTANQGIEEPIHQANETSEGADIVTAIDLADERDVMRAAVKRDDPLGQRKQSDSPYNSTR